MNVACGFLYMYLSKLCCVSTVDISVIHSFLQLLAVIYDPQYALRLCSEHKLTRACVLIYAAMGLYEESVDHALLVSVTFASAFYSKDHDVIYY